MIIMIMMMTMIMIMMMMRMTAGTSFGSAVNCLANKKGEMTTLPTPNVLYYCITVHCIEVLNIKCNTDDCTVTTHQCIVLQYCNIV